MSSTDSNNELRVGASAPSTAHRAGHTGVLTKQQQQKLKDEQARQRITNVIEGIYEKTKGFVEAKLGRLDEEVATVFDAGVNAALAAMKNYVEERITRYKIDRYLLRLGGSILWIRDQFMGLPSEVNAYYEEGRRIFSGAMNTVIVRVADLVESRLAEAKKIVAAGQAEIRSFVASQPKELQAFAQDAERSVSSQFDELRSSIDAKKNQLAQALAQKYKEAFDKANEELKKIQDENKGLVQAFVEKLVAIIKILAEFKDKLMSLLRKGWDTIKLILAAPIAFLGNLITAIKGGIEAFVKNLPAHLERGFMKWLFGSLATAGIEIPADLTLPSILKLVLAVLGLTPDRIRAKAVKLLGPTAVAVIEKLLEYAKALISGGPAALWEMVKEDLSTLKQMVIDAIKSWLVETVIKQAVMKLVSMFNPAGAIIQALIAIYNTVMFLIENAAKLVAFVEAIVNSIAAIAKGVISGAISWIETALGNMIPLLIGFLARLIGLGGISDKIKEIIKKVQGVVDRAIDKAIAKIIAVVKKLFGRGTPPRAGDSPASAEVKRQVKRELQGKQLKSGDDPNALLHSIYTKYRPHGLKGVKFVPAESGKQVDVLVNAS